jgi:hypothetical protein
VFRRGTATPYRLPKVTPPKGRFHKPFQGDVLFRLGSFFGSDSMLMHFSVTVRGEPEGNRCHGKRNHSCPLWTDNRTYRTRGWCAGHRGPPRLRLRGMSNLRSSLEQHPQPVSTAAVGPAVTRKAGSDQGSGTPFSLRSGQLPPTDLRRAA